MASSSKLQVCNKAKAITDIDMLGSTLPTNISFMISWIGKVQEILFIYYDVHDLVHFHELLFPNYAQMVMGENMKPLVLVIPTF